MAASTITQYGDGMRLQIDGNPDYGHLRVELAPGERFLAEGGSMTWMDTGVTIKARLLGGFLRALIRKLTGGESLFVGEYASDSGGEVVFSPASPGMVVQRTMAGDSITLTAGSFFACTPGIELRTRFGGLRSVFSGEGLFFMECSGTGELFFNSFGSIVEKEINGSFVVDTSHVVAWEPGLSYSIRGMGGIKSTLLSGEGLVMEFSGSGKLYLQTRTLPGIASWLTPFAT
jgi:uncharacterized protein (TIGR00266 family)